MRYRKMASQDVMYHVTDIDRADRIWKEGLKVNQPATFTISGQHWNTEIYGCTPIFLSFEPWFHSMSDVSFNNYHLQNIGIFEVDAGDLPLVADIPSLLDKKAKLNTDDDSGELWLEWNEEEFPEELDDVREDPNVSGFRVKDLVQPGDIADAAIFFTGTAACPFDIPPDKILSVDRIGEEGESDKEYRKLSSPDWYHGTKVPKKDLKLEPRRKGFVTILFSIIEVTRHGVFLSSSKSFASEFGDFLMKVKPHVDSTVDIHDASLEFADSIDPNGPDAEYARQASHLRNTWEMFDGKLGDKFVAFLESRGYDSVTFDEYLPEEVCHRSKEEQEATTMVVLDPTKIEIVDEKELEPVYRRLDEESR